MKQQINTNIGIKLTKIENNSELQFNIERTRKQSFANFGLSLEEAKQLKEELNKIEV